MLSWWTTLDATTQSAIAVFIAGLILWGLQKIWTGASWLPGNANAAAWKQKLAAILLAIAAAATKAVATGDWKSFISTAFLAFAGSQLWFVSTGANTALKAKLKAKKG
jgi:hypothetical protein